MRPTFLGFEMGRKGLAVAQKGLDITGQNLANISTPGYTRQRIDQVSVSAYGYTSRNAGNRIDFGGQGVTITGIQQTRDTFLDKRFREEYSDNCYYQEKVDALADIANIVDEFASADSGLLASVNQISSALQTMTGEKATDRSCANVLRTSFQGLIQTLHDYSNGLDEIAEQQAYNLEIAINDVNDISAKIADLNEQIVNEIALNSGDVDVYGPNELLDNRNLLLDELSQYGNVQIKEEDDNSVTVMLGDHVIVKGNKADKIQTMSHPNNVVTMHWNSSNEQVKLTSGSLLAATEVINGRGPDLQSEYESHEKGVLYYKDQLDTFARTLAGVMNNILPTQTDANGNPVGENFRKLFGALVEGKNGIYEITQDVEITAANISISQEWTDEVSYVFPSATSLTNSQYFSDMNARLLTNKNTEFMTGSQTFNGSFRDFITDIHNTCTGEESYYQGRLDASGAVADQLLNQRDSVSAVSKDEETTNMLTYQKSFEAMSRIITAMDEMLDVIINQMGLVGR
ncbi:MAG: flagellar hook-associated protein FlgK [Oscillospiraceae bacterium]|nr:flagellar hook-associated protein FlgK [Oscillospiraceae bacterium]